MHIGIGDIRVGQGKGAMVWRRARESSSHTSDEAANISERRFGFFE